MNRQVTGGLTRGREKRSMKKEVFFMSADRANFKEIVPGAYMAALWGNPDSEPHGSFTKFDPGFDAGTHTHTNDVWLTVLRGAYLYKDAAGEKRVGPGEFIRIPGGWKHWSGGDANEGALFYEEASGRFDVVPAN